MSRTRIAVVEDNPSNLMLLVALVEERWAVDEYVDGPSALEGIPGSDVALIVLDISLPGMDGVEVLKQLRQDPRTRDLPMVALTAHAMAGDRERFLAEGFDAYLTKPIVDDDLLLQTLADLIEGGRP